MVKRLTFQERIDVVKYAARHGNSGAARQCGIAATQVDSWVAFEKAGCRELYDPAYKSPEITDELLQSIFSDLDNGLSLLQACIKYGFKNTGNLSVVLKNTWSALTVRGVVSLSHALAWLFFLQEVRKRLN